jgi:uncharacterized membrane protein
MNLLLGFAFVFGVLALFNGLQVLHNAGVTALDSLFGPIPDKDACYLQLIPKTPWHEPALQTTFKTPWVYPVVAVVAAIAGRYAIGIATVSLRTWQGIRQRGPQAKAAGEERVAAAAPTRRPINARRSAVLVQIFLVLFLVCVGIGLSYETYGVWKHNNPWTITWIVRCINQSNAWFTLLTLAVVSFVFGQWFLYSKSGTVDTTFDLSREEE